MKTFYSTTRAAWHDTQQIAKQKWLQQLRYPSTSQGTALLAEPTTTQPMFHDTKLQTTQKILTALQ